MNTNSDSVLHSNISLRVEEENSERDKYLTHVGISLTDKCNINCRHCIIDCNSLSKNEWDGDSLSFLINQVKDSNVVKTIGFTGGEPFLEMQKLKNAVNQCNMSGIKTSVVTNGFWATNLERTQIVLDEMKGLSKIAISTDKFHQEFISIQNVRNILKIGNEIELECQIRVSHLNDPIGEIREITKQFSEFEGGYELTSQPIQFFGRAATHLERKQLYSYDAMNLACRTADRVLFLPTGEVFACCGPQDSITRGHPLWLGNIQKDSIDTIFQRADSNPIIHILRLWGPGALIRIIEEQAKKENVEISSPSVDEKREICSLCRYALDDKQMLKILKNAILEQSVTHTVAAARLLNFAETSMILNEEEI